MDNQKVDLMFIQETWLRKCDTSIIVEIKELGYTAITSRKSRKLDWGGGVCLLCKTSINVIKVRSKPYKSFEHLICKLLTKSGLVYFVNIYRPEYSLKNKYTVKQFIVEFVDFLEKYIPDNHDCILIGDFNFHVELANINDNQLTSCQRDKKKDALHFLETLSDFGLNQLVNRETHLLGGTLDLLITHDPSIITNHSVGLQDEVCKSDHFAVNFYIDRHLTHKDLFTTITRRNYGEVNHDTLIADLKNSNLSLVTPDLDVNSTVQIFNSSIATIMDLHCPAKTHKVRSRPSQQWYTSELGDLKRTKRRAERKYKKYPTSRTRNELNEIKLVYKKAIFKAREKFYSNISEEEKNDMGKLFKRVNYLVDNNSNRNVLPTATDPTQLANDLGNFFADKVNAIRTEISDRIDHAQHGLGIEHSFSGCTLFDFEPSDKTELTEIITSMNNKFSTVDPIPPSFIKQHLDYFLPILLDIVNKSLSMGFPDNLKHTTVNPIYKEKGSDSELFKSYRPVSNLPFLSKLIEKVALKRINKHLQSFNLLPLNQSGYIKQHSCETAICKITNDLQQIVHEGKMAVLVLLDLSAAFDTIDHSILINLLQHKFGITGNVLQWLKSYSKGRTFSVKIKHVKGGRILMIYGVPQGSILGPLLFILYISDIPEVACNHDVLNQGYADDTQLYIGFNPVVDFTNNSNKLKDCIKDLESWMTSNFLQLNVDKTEVLFVGKPNDFAVHSLQIEIGIKTYSSDSSQNVRSLGVELDKTLSMKATISDRVKSCYFNLKKISRIRSFLSVRHKLFLINAFILSKLDYCNIALACVPTIHLKPLEKVLNAAMRFVYSLKPRMNTSSYLQKSHILPVAYRIKFKTCTTAFKVVHQQCPSYMRDIVKFREPSERNLRSNMDTYVLAHSNYTNSIEYTMIMNWNSLPYHIRSSTTLNIFKKKLKTFYFALAFSR